MKLKEYADNTKWDNLWNRSNWDFKPVFAEINNFAEYETDTHTNYWFYKSGLNKEDIKVYVEDNQLVVEYKDNTKYVESYKGYKPGNFTIRQTLPKNIGNIEAEYNDGILKVKFEKLESIDYTVKVK